MTGSETEAGVPWLPRVTADGSWTLVHASHGEACHSRSGAWLEARERYAGACDLRRRAREEGPETLRLLDVGTGLGWNLAAALEALDGSRSRLHAVSLEVDARVIDAALELFADPARRLAAAEPWHAPMRAALAAARADPGRAASPAGVPLGERGCLRLVLGDGRRTLPALSDEEPFDAVFLDPFSRRSDATLWEPGFLREVARRTASGGWLASFTCSLAARAELAAAGLRVGRSGPVGEKAQGTLASPDREPPPLDPRTRRRLGRRLHQRRSEARPPEPEAPPEAPPEAGAGRPTGAPNSTAARGSGGSMA